MDEWIWLNLCEIVNTMKPLYFTRWYSVGGWRLNSPHLDFPLLISADLGVAMQHVHFSATVPRSRVPY